MHVGRSPAVPFNTPSVIPFVLWHPFFAYLQIDTKSTQTATNQSKSKRQPRYLYNISTHNNISYSTAVIHHHVSSVVHAREGWSERSDCSPTKGWYPNEEGGHASSYAEKPKDCQACLPTGRSESQETSYTSKLDWWKGKICFFW